MYVQLTAAPAAAVVSAAAVVAVAALLCVSLRCYR